MNHVNVNIAQLRNQQLQSGNSGLNVRDDVRDLSTDQLRQLSEDSGLPWCLMLLNLTGELNIGTMIRSGHLMGVHTVFLLGRRSFDKRGLVGANHYTRIERIWAVTPQLELDPLIFEQTCVQHKLIPICVEQGGTNCFDMPWQRIVGSILDKDHKPVLVMGPENGGIPASMQEIALRLGGGITSIPQRGVMRSFNVSQAFAIVISQIMSSMEWL